jgi:hypothetical protein
MRYLRAIATISLISVALPACGTAQKSTVYKQNDQGVLRQQIERNWSIDSNAAEACSEPVELQILLTPDGSGKVTGVEILPGLPAIDACRLVAESARRAVLISSPLKLPLGSNLSSIKMRFDPTLIY